MNVRVVIFDWDGTLVDSVEHIADSLHQAATELGFPALEREAYRDIIGLGMVEASPVTGRTHQIRVHSAWAGHPIAGDDKYMDDVSLKAFRSIGGQRLMLHARALEFTLPVSGEAMRLEAPYDDAFNDVLRKLSGRLKGNDQ